jgi:hypothetical protein
VGQPASRRRPLRKAPRPIPLPASGARERRCNSSCADQDVADGATTLPEDQRAR